MVPDLQEMADRLPSASSLAAFRCRALISWKTGVASYAMEAPPPSASDIGPDGLHVGGACMQLRPREFEDTSIIQ